MNLAKIVKQAKQVVDKNGDKIAAGVGKATDFVDKKTGGKHREKLERIDDLAAKLDKTKGQGKGDDGNGDRPAAEPPA